MALQILVTGAARIYIDAGQGSGLSLLGYTRDGVTIREVIYQEDVKGDQNGGESGPPIDVQHFGEHHEIETELVTVDMTFLATVKAKVNNGTPGILPTAGSLMVSAGLYHRLLIYPVGSNPRNYLCAFPRQPLELNKGSKHTRHRVSWFCMAPTVGGTIYNTTTS